jgi:uncharacterized protein
MPKFRDIDVIDTFFNLPVRQGEQKPEALMKDWIQPLYRHPVGQNIAGLNYLFKNMVYLPDGRESIEFAIAEMDRFGVERGLTPASLEDGPGRVAISQHPDRFSGVYIINPNDGMEGIRGLVKAKRDWNVVAAFVTPALVNPQVPINDKKLFPIYCKCIELDIPIFILTGIPGPRVPYAAQHPEHLDEICWFFPDLKVIMRHGADPWTDLAVKLLLKWPNLFYSTSAFSPKYYPEAIINFANTRGAEKIIYGGYFAAGLSYDRIFAELNDVPFKQEVWPLFLRENALRVLNLPS